MSFDIQFGQIMAALHSLSARLDKIDDRLNEIDDRLDKIDNRFNDVDNRFNDVDNRFNDVDNRLENVERHFGIIDQRFNVVEKRTTDLEAFCHNMHSEIAAKLGHIDGNIASLKTLRAAREVNYQRKIANQKMLLDHGNCPDDIAILPLIDPNTLADVDNFPHTRTEF
ncbi:hypothetical protein CTA2_1345 [Colletotrichum tanaceti]|uniref:t-SNARE coiled-coil homology domain-containing protein n=1 Tax=Colletotrichum tanaceti TaxID=1306861 RepID=A0A4U6XQA1_9PEZI|nr:hypothetical protein CTA2_1345 [Colletotrichum tanaceti]TKW58000.1 hypothetical protein CTA1_753 [Colletotrichum tanaceti]